VRKQNGKRASSPKNQGFGSPCVRYQGCDPGYPVVWCQTTGQGHNRQDSYAGPFWTFFREF